MFPDWISLCSPYCPRTFSVYQAVLEPGVLPDATFKVFGLKVYVTTVALNIFLCVHMHILLKQQEASMIVCVYATVSKGLQYFLSFIVLLLYYCWSFNFAVSFQGTHLYHTLMANVILDYLFCLCVVSSILYIFCRLVLSQIQSCGKSFLSLQAAILSY